MTDQVKLQSVADNEEESERRRYQERDDRNEREKGVKRITMRGWEERSLRNEKS